MTPSDMTPGELWMAFVNGYIDYKTLLLETHKNKFCRNMFRFPEESMWGARALRVIADELDRRSANLEHAKDLAEALSEAHERRKQREAGGS